MFKKRPRMRKQFSRSNSEQLVASKNEADYWVDRLFKNTFTYKGKRRQVNGWSVKIQLFGERRTFSLSSGNPVAAAAEACQIYRTICSQGWGAVNQRLIRADLATMPSASGPALIAGLDATPWVGRLIHRRYPEPDDGQAQRELSVRIEHLGDSRWYVIRNIVYVLGRIAHQGVERALDRALHHEDVRVRKEAVRALGNIESPTARAYLVSAFRDLDAGVRIQAAMTLALKRDDRAAQSILGVVSGPEFSRRDSNERAAFFEALGRCGSDALLPRLESMLTRGGLFRSGGSDEERLHAALALAWLGTPASIAVLEREMGSKRDMVRKAVETALASVRSAGLGRAEGAREEDSE